MFPSTNSKANIIVLHHKYLTVSLLFVSVDSRIYFIKIRAVKCKNNQLNLYWSLVAHFYC